MEAQASLAGLKKVAIENLTIGMYVAQLDHPWIESNFPVQGFYLRSSQSIERVTRECQFVYVDPRRYDSSLTDVKLGVVSDRGAIEATGYDKDPRARIYPHNRQEYNDTTELGGELELARTSIEEATEILKSCVHKLQSAGGFDIDDIERAISPLVASVMRNNSAMAALLRMRAVDDYTFSHSIACAVWGAIIGRQLGFPPKDIDSLALSCSLMDIGKTNLPPELLKQAESPTEEQWLKLQGHVQEGLNLLEENKVDDEMLRLTIQSHHERYDGSGYPHGLAGNDIPLYARIAGIVDSYDAMITEKPYAEVRSSYAAVQELQSKAGVLYQKELVEQFIQAIGVFPVGAIVEINTGEVGVVVAQDTNRRLKPKVILLLDSDKKQRSHLVIVDLANQESNDSGTLSWWITKELPNSAYGIDPAKYFL